MNNSQDLGEWYVNRIRQRLLQLNKNWICCIAGEPGSGKSYSALSLAGLIGPFHLVLTPQEFLELLAGDKIKKGDVIIFDEAGVGMAARDWQSLQNKLLGSVLQTFRHRNIALIFTVPNLSFMDVQARKLLQAYLQTATIDFKNALSGLQAYDIQVNPRLDKIYFKCPRLETEEGRVITMTHLWLPKPSAEVIAWYEERKSAFTRELNANALASIKGEGESKKRQLRPEPNLEELRERVLADPQKYIKQYGNGKLSCNRVAIQSEFSLPLHKSEKLKLLVDEAIHSKNLNKKLYPTKLSNKEKVKI